MFKGIFQKTLYPLFSRLPIRYKFAWSSIIILVIISAFLLWYFLAVQEKKTIDLMENKVQTMADMVAMAVGIALDSNNFHGIHRALNWARRDRNLSYIRVMNQDEKIIASIETGLIPKKIDELPRQKGIYRSGEIMNAMVEITMSGKRYGTLQLGYSLKELHDQLFKDLLRGVVICLSILFIGMLVTFLISNIITRYITLLNTAAKDFTQGNEDVQIQIPTSDEIGELGKTFNLMLRNINNHIHNLKRINLWLGKEIAERKKKEKELKSSQEQLRNLSNRLQTIQEEEKTRIAREIHDELGQALTAISLDVAWIQKRTPGVQEDTVQKLRSMTSLIDDTIKKVQSIATELRPQILDVLGLGDALKWQTREFQNRTGIQCNLIMIPDQIELDPGRSISFFRVYQESLTNIARHANASKVFARFQKNDDFCELEIRDNGVGIKEEKIFNSTSLGLIGIRERVLLWGGTVNINGCSDAGTTVLIRIPLNKNLTTRQNDHEKNSSDHRG